LLKSDLVLLLYSFATLQPDNNPALLPPLKDIVASFFTNLHKGTLLNALGASLFRIILGFLIGTTLAVIVGCLVGWYKPVAATGLHSDNHHLVRH